MMARTGVIVRGVLAALVAGVLLVGGAGAAQAADGPGGTRPDPGDAAARPVPTRPGLRAAYPFIPPAPPPPPAPVPAMPAICVQRAKIICASKAERTLRYVEAGGVWLATPVAFGRPGYETPSGLYAVQVKDANAWSYEFNAPMPYSLEYDLGRGIYIHYSATFASVGPTYIGSHGCINIGSLDAAKTLFNRVPVGTPVYVY